MRRIVLTLLLTLAAAWFLVRPVPLEADGGTFSGELPAPGSIGLRVWSGGALADLEAEAGGGGGELRSFWAADGGHLVGYIVGAPEPVNRVFLGWHPSRMLDVNTPVILVCHPNAGGAGGGASGGGTSSAAWHTGAPSCPVFPASNAWNTDISKAAVHPRSTEWIASIGLGGRMHADFGTVWQGAPIGIPYAVVTGDVPLASVSFDYASESDPGPYPIPADVPIEAGSDAHVLVVDDRSCTLYELFAAERLSPTSWHAGSGAVFDLTSNALRPDSWTSADAAGLPIFAGLVRYDEVAAGEIMHALRFTASRTQRAFLHPATHWASSIEDASVPPMGARLRMRASYDCAPLSREVQVICRALKRYGMLLADNGSNWYVSGAPDPRWDDEALHDLSLIPGSAFEVVDTGERLHTPANP